MQRKIVVDTNIYIDLFNDGRYLEIPNAFANITYLAHPVLHELWMGARSRTEVRALLAWQDTFIKLKRLIVPQIATQVLIGQACRKLRISGKLDPGYPKHYNDITIAALARQIGATLLTRNKKDFSAIRSVFDFDFEIPA